MASVFWSRLLATCRWRLSEQQLEEELEDHLEHLRAAEMQKGATPEAASQAARREFGSVEAAKELYREHARFRALEAIAKDVSFALRQARRNPVFTATAVISLALGIGANVALFSFVNALLLQHLEVPEAARLVLFKNGNEQAMLSYDEINELNRHAKTVTGVAGTYAVVASLMLSDQPEWTTTELVTGEYFSVMGVSPLIGSVLKQRDLDRAAGDPVCLVSFQFWRGRLGAGNDVLGRHVFINTHPYRIIGVLPRGFRGTNLQRPTDFFLPVTRLADFLPAFSGVPNFDWRKRLYFFPTFARLKPGPTALAASSELSRINKEYLEAAGRGDRKPHLQAADGSQGVDAGSGLGPPTTILLAIAGVVLLIACANLATLLLSRTSARSPEFAIRLAIGASRRRIVTQGLIESSVLVISGCVAGVLLAYVLVRVLLFYLNRGIPAVQQLHVAPGGSALAFAVALGAVSVILFGGSSALRAGQTTALGSSAGNVRPGTRLRKAFCIAQLSLSLAVLFAAGLLTQSLRNLQTISLGYPPDEVAAIELKPATGGYTGSRADQFYRRVVERLRAVPGIRSASVGLGLNLKQRGFAMELPARPGAKTAVSANIYGVGTDYFTTFGARVVAGRDFNVLDQVGKPTVYVVNEHLASRYFGRENPIGQTLEGKGTVVGVVSDIRDQGIRNDNENTVYQAASQLLASSQTIFVRCQGSCQPFLHPIRETIRQLDPNTPILSESTISTALDGALSSDAALGFLSSLFAALALSLSATGLYGILSYSLTRRTREIGLRIALGALPTEVAKLMVKEVAEIVLSGIVLGSIGAVAVSNLLKSQLFGIGEHESSGALLIAIVTLTGIALAAVLAPARKALKISPQQALRVD